jgi:Domain of unknown function (DUF4276)
MIFECGPQGADKKVCEKFARQIKPDIQIVSVTLDTKPNLVASCGRVAAQLIKQGCDRILIIWDLYPAWREKKQKPCRKEDRQAIQNSLANAGVTSTNVYLICIEPELEEWFLYDLTALSSVLSTTTHPVTIRKSPNGGTNPKKTLNKLFEENTGKKYNDLIHADIIAKNISKLDKIAKKCQSFERFVRKIT